jgi:predicted dehydrogenase
LSKILRIGIIGVTGRGEELRKYFHQPKKRAVVTAGADISLKALEAFKKANGNAPFTTTDYKELLARKDVEVIVVTSPDFTHEEYSVAALKAKKHVYLEKPMAITTAGCDRVLKAWKSSGKKLLVGFNMRHMAVFQLMKKLIDSGKIGTVKAAWVRHFVGSGGHYYFHDWHGTRKNTTSLLLQKGSHDIDMIHYLTGSYVKKVAAFGSRDYFGGNKPNNLRCPACKLKKTCLEVDYSSMNRCCFRKEVDVEDNSQVIMELENGIKASYMQCHFAPEYFRNYTIIGTKGRIENISDGDTVVLKLRKKFIDEKKLKEIRYKVKAGKDRHYGADALIVENFLDYLLKNKKPVATALAGRMSVAAGCAATDSLRNGGKMLKIKKAPKGIK